MAAGAVRRSEPRVLGGWAYWLEERPLSAGRGTVVRVRLGDARPQPAAQPSDVAHTGDADIRTSVHEYGGGAWLPLAAPDGGHWVLGVCMADQRIRLFDVSGREPARAITAAPSVPRGLRYADPALVPVSTESSQADCFGPITVWVRESHEEGAHKPTNEPVNELVSVRLDGSVEVLASGADFYSSPRPSPDGRRLAYLSWDHPNMPWDHVRLHLLELRDGRPVAGSDRVLADGPALAGPAWNLSGELHVVTDADGWWSIHRVDLDSGATEPVARGAPATDEPGREFAGPAWVFAQATYGWTPDGALWCTWMSGGTGHIGIARGGELAEVASGFTEFGRIAPTASGSVVTVAASWTRRASIVEIASDGSHRQLSADEPTPLSSADVSTARPFSFASDDGRTAHAFFYAPANSSVEAPPAEAPPLIVLSHGGPTGAARSSLDLSIQFWTTRGIAVVDVNYGGSTGYGTAYRNLLHGQWGVVDQQDCIAAARHLAAEGKVDPARMTIKGGSAGGYTTLCALVSSDVFAAGISRYGVADLESLARDTHKFEARYLDGLVGAWPEQAALYAERSPVTHTSKLRTPMIVLQGADDRVVPPSQAEQLVAALAAAGVPHSYVLFEGEGHGFRKAPNMVAALEAELSFLGQVLGFEPAGDIAPVEVRRS